MSYPNDRVPFFRLEINKFVWWDIATEGDGACTAVDVRMFVGPWPKIVAREVYAREHGMVTLEDNGWKVFYGRRPNTDFLPFHVTATVAYYSTKEDIIAKGYDFNPNTWQPFVAKLKTDEDSKAAAIACFTGKHYTEEQKKD